MPSQLGQDHFVLDFLGGLRNGYFLDSGASDGVSVNNTLLLERAFGWTGICVEPNEGFFAALVNNRQCHCVNCCLYDREGPVDFIEASTLGGIVQEYHPSLLKYVHSSGSGVSVQKNARTIGSLLLQYGAPSIIDYWSLDTEGSELAILKSFPFDRYALRVLTVEHNHLPVRAEIKDFLEGKGYRRIREMGIDDCYVNGRHPGESAWQSRVWKRG